MMKMMMASRKKRMMMRPQESAMTQSHGDWYHHGDCQSFIMFSDQECQGISQRTEEAECWTPGLLTTSRVTVSCLRLATHHTRPRGKTPAATCGHLQTRITFRLCPLNTILPPHQPVDFITSGKKLLTVTERITINCWKVSELKHLTKLNSLLTTH